ncbi:hypothetical protein K2173_001578 [Erythroxylum novogranatense]|uniref:EF-hand domain-containing protein n=1 Tax=Erythroxylum novogranatense TaxID=1862640 RepID=A0AAV8T513_9ROSI|nr:hypothetical protein K2173_001578 [Erythroxylum novogranatense]
MACLVFLVSILLVLGKVQCRVLKLTSDDLVSDGFDQFNGKSSSFPSLNDLRTSNDTCLHYYGFLPCANNAPGYFFLIIVYEYLLFVGDQVLAKGSQKLFSILGVGLYGATVFRVLMVLPSIVLIIASGLIGSTSDSEYAVIIGVASLAGGTVFNLTIQWGICVFLGKPTTTRESTEEAKVSTERHLWLKEKLTLTGSGVETDQETSTTAGIMLLSLVPFIMVQFTRVVNSQTWSYVVLSITLVVCVLGQVYYFFYQSGNEEIQKRSLEFYGHEFVLAEFLNHMQKRAKKGLVNEHGKLDASAIKSVFHVIDKDKNNCISKSELETFLKEIKSGKLPMDQGFAFQKLINLFDRDEDHLVTETEFMRGCESMFGEVKEIVFKEGSREKPAWPQLKEVIKPLIDRKKEEIAKIEKELSNFFTNFENRAFAGLLTDGKPDEAKIHKLFEEFDKDNDRKVSIPELKAMIMSRTGNVELDFDNVATKLMKIFDKNDDNELSQKEFTDGFRKFLGTEEETQRNEDKLSWDSVKATLQVLLGIAIVTFLVTPLLLNALYLSQEIGMPVFYISFIVLPVAMNFRTVIASVLPVSQKKKVTSSITFSEIYGGVFMNNILGLWTVLAIILVKGLTWDYSAEVVVTGFVTTIIGLLAYGSTTYELWTAILALSLYPFSLLLFYVLHSVIGLK